MAEQETRTEMTKVHEAQIVDQQGQGLVKPVARIEDLVEQYKEFTEFKNTFLQGVPGGVISMWAPGGEKDYLAKPAWVAAATLFGITTEVIREGWSRLPDGTMQFSCVVRARQGRRSCDAVGVCDTAEPFYQGGTKLKEGEKVPEGVTVYNLRKEIYKDGRPSGEYEWRRYLPKNLSACVGFAQTRAQNRAISTLCGGGENSYEEMGGEGGTPKGKGGRAAPQPRASSSAPASREAAGKAAAASAPRAADPAPATDGSPAWWKVGSTFDATTTATDEKGNPAEVNAAIRFAAADIPQSGSKKKSWPTFEREAKWKGKTWLQLFKECIRTRLAGTANPGTDPIEWILSTEGCGAYGSRGGNWLGEQAAALDYMANRYLVENAPADSPWRDTEAAKALGAAPRAKGAAAAPAADGKAQAAADAARKAGAAVQTGAEAGLADGQHPETCTCSECWPDL